MANKKYYTSETIEFQNGDRTEARPLTLRKLKAFSEIFNDYTIRVQKASRYMESLYDEAEAAGEKNPDVEAIYKARKEAGEIPEEVLGFDDGDSYIDTLTACALIALLKWGVESESKKPVGVDLDYIEEEIDVATITRICEIAGSMKLGDISDDIEGKA